MEAAELFYTIVSVVGGILIGILGFFLKRTITTVDQSQQQIRELRDGKTDDKALIALRQDMEKRTDKLSKDIEGIKEDYITKDDFFREQAKTDRKLDMILDILLGRSGKNG